MVTRLNRLVFFAAILGTAPLVTGLADPGTAIAANAYLNGITGVGPKYETITGPQGQKCAKGCTNLTYDNTSEASSEAAIAKFVAANGSSGNTIWTYSLSTQGAILYLNDHPEDRNTWILLGSPSTTENLGDYDYRPLNNPNANVTFATKQGDSVAQPKAPNASLATHVSGYDNLDLRTPTTSTKRPGTHTVENVYGTAPAPTPSFNLFNPATWSRTAPASSTTVQKVTADKPDAPAVEPGRTQPAASSQLADRQVARSDSQAAAAARSTSAIADKPAAASPSSETRSSTSTAGKPAAASPSSETRSTAIADKPAAASPSSETRSTSATADKPAA